MTINAWAAFIFLWIVLILIAYVIIVCYEHIKWVKPVTIIVTIILIALSLWFGLWYFSSTADGIRSMTDERSNIANGLERTITVYTANGDKLAEYHGKIDLEADKDYVKFDWNGKRYIYYNCFVETIAILP